MAAIPHPVLVGREHDIRVLTDAVARAAGAESQLVLLEGEPGMGKTSLLTTVFGSASSERAVRWFRCDSFESEVAFGVAGLLLDCWIDAGSEVDVGRRLLARFAEWEDEAEAVITLIIDDAQWMDVASARAIRFALRRLRTDRFATVISRRPVLEDPWLGLFEAPTAATIRLGPLLPRDVGDWAEGLRGWRLSEAARERIADRSGGLPLLVEALLRDHPDQASLERTTNLPASAAEAAGRMLSSIDPEARLVIEAAAVLDEPATAHALGVVADLADPSAALTSAVLSGLVGADDRDRYRCSHALLREAVYASIPPGRRRSLHRRAALQATGDRRLTHRVSAADRPDPTLVADLILGAAEARAANRFGVAAQLMLHAAELVGEPTDSERLIQRGLLDRLAAADLTGADQLEPSVLSSAPGPLRSLALGALASERGRIGPATSLLCDAVSRAQRSGAASVLGEAAVHAAALFASLNLGPDTVRMARLARESTDPDASGYGLMLSGVGSWLTGNLDQAVALLDSVEVSPGGRSWEADLLLSRAMLLCYCGRTRDSLADCDRALQLEHVWRPSTSQARTYVQRSMDNYYLGNWDEAALDANRARTVAEAGSQPWTVPLAQAISVEVPAGRGQWEMAEHHLAQARAGLDSLPSSQIAGIAAAGAVQLALAREDYHVVMEIVGPFRSDPQLWQLAAMVRSFRWMMTGWIQAAIHTRQLDEADRALAEYGELLRQWPAGPIPSRIHWLGAQLAERSGAVQKAKTLYRRELDDAFGQRFPFMHAQVLHSAGRLERALGNRREAIEHLLRAQQVFTGLRAQPSIERCAEDLAGCGLRAPRPATDPFTLTEREEDVASLVARGLTNKEAAAELFLTAKTIDYHLGNIYAKLGINSRRELRNLRAGPGHHTRP